MSVCGLEDNTVLAYVRCPFERHFLIQDYPLDLRFAPSCFDSIHGILKGCGCWLEDGVFSLFAKRNKKGIVRIVSSYFHLFHP